MAIGRYRPDDPLLAFPRIVLIMPDPASGSTRLASATGTSPGSCSSAPLRGETGSMGERAGLFVYGGDLEVGMASHPCLRDAAAPAARKDFSFTDELDGRTTVICTRLQRSVIDRQEP